MKPLRPWTGIILVAILLQSGCTVLALAKAATSPVKLASTAVVQTSQVGAKSLQTGGEVTGEAVMATGRAAASVRSSGRVSSASVGGAGRVSTAGVGSATRVTAARQQQSVRQEG
ncbi:MAG: hypothetical protein J6386_12990 [Candidatus Synoicihabitans palmerolidicus]|nr:hypothetical protein [Candidatus Synoicihabitans palmerolidicus]